MAAPGVVVGEPFWQQIGALGVARKHLRIGPFPQKRAVESFHLAVLPGAMRADQHVACPEARKGGLEIVRESITERIVGA